MNIRSIIKGVGIGMAIGGTTAYFKGMMTGSGMKKATRKKAKMMMKAAEGIIGNLMQ